MKNRSSLNNLLNRDRKKLYIILSIVMISVLTLTVVYAALSTTLNITGNAEVTAASWDIHFDNIQINTGSVEASKLPTIIDLRTINFAVGLKEPGDYYKFTVDIVNDGTIDAMIDSVIKTPELTQTQAKYLKYEIEYTDGNSINNKQLLPKKMTKTMSVLVAYRSDVASSDIPTAGESLNLSFTMNYIQSDETGTVIPENKPIVRVASGDVNTIGSEICIGEECFHLIENDGKSITLLSKYNLYVGNRVENDTFERGPLDNPIVQQHPSALGALYTPEGNLTGFPWIGTIKFSNTNYWLSQNINEDNYIYNMNATAYEYLNNYKNKLEENDILIEEIRLIKYDELVKLGCPSEGGQCKNQAPEWIYTTSYWAGNAYDSEYVWHILSSGKFYRVKYSTDYGYGIRPVIKMSLVDF